MEQTDKLNRLAADMATFKVRGGATFGPDEHRKQVSASVSVSTSRDWDSRLDYVSQVEVTFYGAMVASTGEVDSRATATVRYSLRQDDTYCYVKSTRWAGGKYGDMPEGARHNVAATILGMVDALAIDWRALAVECVTADKARRVAGLRDEAHRATVKADRLEAETVEVRF